MPGRVAEVVSKAITLMVGEEFGMITAGARDDEEDELDDDDL